MSTEWRSKTHKETVSRQEIDVRKSDSSLYADDRLLLTIRRFVLISGISLDVDPAYRVPVEIKPRVDGGRKANVDVNASELMST